MEPWVVPTIIAAIISIVGFLLNYGLFSRVTRLELKSDDNIEKRNKEIAEIKEELNEMKLGFLKDVNAINVKLAEFKNSPNAK